MKFMIISFFTLAMTAELLSMQAPLEVLSQTRVRLSTEKTHKLLNELQKSYPALQQSKQDLLDKALLGLVYGWHEELKESGVQLAEVLIKAGANPHYCISFVEEVLELKNNKTCEVRGKQSLNALATGSLKNYLDQLPESH